MDRIEKFKSIEKELESIMDEREAILRRYDTSIELSRENLNEIRGSFDALMFVIYGSLLGLAINLVANIIHDNLVKYSFDYYFGVLLLLIVSLYLLINFVIKKWNQVMKKDKLLNGMVQGKKDRNYYFGQFDNLGEKAKKLIQDLENI